MDNVRVTLANWLYADDARSIGIPAQTYRPGESVLVPFSSLRRLLAAGQISRETYDALTINPTVAPVAAPLQSFVGPYPPRDVSGPYVWFQTGTGSDRTGTTIWIEDEA